VRLLNEATLLGASEILRLLPNDQRLALEQPVHDAIRRAVRHYDQGLKVIARQMRPLEHGKQRL
jgi:hypothetical protein